MFGSYCLFIITPQQPTTTYEETLTPNYPDSLKVPLRVMFALDLIAIIKYEISFSIRFIYPNVGYLVLYWSARNNKYTFL